MEKWYKKAIRYGHRFRAKDGTEYVSIEYVEKEQDTLRVVRQENKRRWELLRAWRRNKVHEGTPEWDTDDQERAGYEMTVSMDDLEPIDMIRFIDPHYKNKFLVKSGDKVMVNGKEQYAIYIDETHMHIGTPDTYWSCYHICEFAEICERAGAVVEPVKE